MAKVSIQEGHIRQRRTKRHGVVYELRYRVTTTDVKRRQVTETLRGLADSERGWKEARATLASRIHGRTNGNNLHRRSDSLSRRSSMTLREFVDCHFKPYLSRRQVRASTLAQHESFLRIHILPELGEMALAEISPARLDELMSKVGAAVSPGSAQKIYQTLHSILELAVDDELIDRSPLKRQHKPVYKRTEKPAWTPQEVRNILEKANPHYRALLVTVAMVGARIGEVLALQWRHVDFEKSRVLIEQTLWRGDIHDVKNGESRVIPMHDVLIQTLLSHKARSIFTELDDFVFCREDGRWLDDGCLRKCVLNPAIKAAGIAQKPFVHSFHSFRHTAATLIYHHHKDVKASQTYLGHRTPRTTDIYLHDNKADPEAAATLERLVFGELLQNVTRTLQ